MGLDIEQRPLLEVNHISSGYDPDVPAIYGISLDLQQGEIVSIFGRNGAGKSTILQVLAGMQPVQEGRVLYNDREITNIHPGNAFKAGIAYVPDYVSLFPNMTVYENLEAALFGHGQGLNFPERLNYILQFFPILRTQLKQNAHYLTSAEQRLLEIARALLWKPRLLLIDEPSLNLSADMRGDVFQTIQRLNREIGLTVLMTEPHTHLRISICERAYLLNNGRIIYEGLHTELLSNHTIMRVLINT